MERSLRLDLIKIMKTNIIKLASDGMTGASATSGGMLYESRSDSIEPFAGRIIKIFLSTFIAPNILSQAKAE
jgi:hypothetical protein